MKLHSNIIGSGFPLVILHGFLGMGDNWKTLAKKYSKLGYEVHLVDQRNHGRSPHSEDFSYEILSADLLEYCKNRDFEKITLLGHSMGGKTAMQFACEYPEKIQHLLIADISPKYYAPHHQDILDSLQALDFLKIKSRVDAENELKKYITHQATRMFLLKNLHRKSPTEFALRVNLRVLSEKVIEIGRALSPDLIFTGKVLFLKGELSNYILNNELDVIQKHFPNYELKTIANAGHWLHAENSSDFFAISRFFLNS